MDDDNEYADLTDGQLAQLENTSSLIRKEEEEKNPEQAESVSTVMLQPTQSDEFWTLSDDELAAIDLLIANVAQRTTAELVSITSDLTNVLDNRNDDTTSGAMNQAATSNDDEVTEPSLEHLNCLRKKFGIPNFRGKQWEIIDAVMNKRRDVCAVMATGYGKSLCFQFPAVFQQKMVLVVCPLISLMRAHVFALEKINVKACLLGSAQYDPNILARIQNGEFSIIFSSPEYLQFTQGNLLLNLLKDRLTLIAIDGECLF